ncbi:uncharacterized protein EKO05_0004524 [Ascochyta rabiei]|uniref:Uncharacterized protein n=1 Tax=Didymella rabiei TaxID=5454 RepID=A0A162ZBN9_DIDRA|nr:uncharacterized protein EKO05_0004524 [Ascochyta rabiei]KZM20519.1 hypothetical protein ST47_g8387 [Ascochyta rabiei]UPX14031.1 hypothetical protein EKO05_0004524 [Ascochyta rabiei]
MFYEGTLQSGIGQAIQQQKLVACFVRDDGATSKQWEDEWLKSGWISNLLAQKAVLLRLENGSTEAGFLAAFCKIESAPTLVVIHNGQLQLQLGSEVGQEEFVNSVRKVLGAAAIPGSASTSTAQTTTAHAEDDLYEDSGPTVTVTTPATRPVSSPAPAPAPAPASAPAPAATFASSNAKGKQRAETPPQAGLAASSSTTNSAQQAARAALQKKKREDAEELARIKGRIEQDKAERKAQAEARKAEREQERTAGSQTQSQPQTSTRGSQAKDVHLNVRLFDGRTIRSTFPRTATLEKEVRKWVDEEFAKLDSDDANIRNRALPPYFFRHILAPKPSRELSAGDENQTLGDIDLAPSATLVLVPVKGYTEAYSAGEDGVVGKATGLVGSAFGLLSSTVGYAGSIVGSFLGTGAAAPQPAQGQAVGGGHGNERAGSSRTEGEDASGIRVRTLADQRTREPRTQQFYNGNQSNVEPRPDDRG